MPESVKKSFSIILVYFALAAGTVIVFWQVRVFDFVSYDDNDYVYQNQHVLDGLTYNGIIWAFTTGHAANWHPLTWLSFMLECQLFGPNAGLMHLVNVLLHLANILLLFAVLKKMTGSLWPSTFVAAVFALHPMHVESVAWIAERKDVLSTLFFMLTLLTYAGYVKRGSLYSYLLTVVAFALGLIAKPMLVTLPFVLLLLDYWPLNRFEPQTAKTSGRQSRKAAPAAGRREVLYRIIIEKIPFFALSSISSIFTFLVQHSSGAVIGINELPLESRVDNVFLSYVTYMGKMFWPSSLTVFHPYDIGVVPSWQVILCVLLLLVISVFVIRFGRKQKYLPVGWFWFIGTLMPVIGLVQSGEQAYADRFTYIPYIGLFIMIAWGLPELLSKWPYRKITFGISMAVVLAALGICGRQQVGYWKNSAALFTHALEVTQNNYVAHYFLAEELRKQGKVSLAMEHCRKALEIKPNYVNAIITLGSVLAEQGDLNQAIGYFQKALKLTSNSASAYDHYNLGVALLKCSKLNDAVVCFTRAVQIAPDFADAHNNLGIALKKQGKFSEALAHFTKAVQLRSDWPTAMGNLALLIATAPDIKNRDANEAVHLAERACELTNYRDPTFLGTLAAAYASAGRFSDAVDSAKKAAALADRLNQPQIRDLIQYHLSFYTQGKPYIESAQKPEPNKP